MELWQAVAGWVVSTGILGYALKRWVDRALDQAERHAQQRSDDRRQRWIVDEEYLHAVGRFLFWTQKGAAVLEQETGKKYWNGDLQSAYEAVKSAEEKRKALDRKQLAEVNEE